MKPRNQSSREDAFAVASLIVIGLMVLGSALAIGSQQIVKNFAGDTRSRAGETQCPAGSCPDGWSFGAGGYYGTCDQRRNEACGSHQGGGSKATTAPTASSGGGSSGDDCSGKDCGAGTCFTGPNAHDGGWGCNCTNGSKLGPSTNPGKCPSSGGNTTAAPTATTVAGTGGTGTTNDCTGKSCGAGTCFTGPNANDGGWGCSCNNGVTLGPSTNPGTCTASTTPPATGGGNTGGACSAGIISFGGCCGVNKRYAWTRSTDCSTRDVCEAESLHAGTSLCTAPTATVTPKAPLTGVSIGVPNPTATAAPSGTTCTAGYLSGGGGCCGPSKSWRVYRNTNCSTENRCDYDNPSCSYVTATPTATPTSKLGDWSTCSTASQCQSNRCEGFQGRTDKQCIPSNYTSDQLRTGACPAGSVTACQGKSWNDVCAFGTTGIATGGGGRCGAGSASSSVCSCVSDPTATLRVSATPTKAANWSTCRVNSDCLSNRCEKDPGDNTYACIPETYTVKKAIGATCSSGNGGECSSGVCAREGDGVYRCQSSQVSSYPSCDTNKILNVTSRVSFSEQCQFQSASFLQLYYQCSSGWVKNSTGTGCIAPATTCTPANTALTGSSQCCQGTFPLNTEGIRACVSCIPSGTSYTTNNGAPCCNGRDSYVDGGRLWCGTPPTTRSCSRYGGSVGGGMTGTTTCIDSNNQTRTVCDIDNGYIDDNSSGGCNCNVAAGYGWNDAGTACIKRSVYCSRTCTNGCTSLNSNGGVCANSCTNDGQTLTAVNGRCCSGQSYSVLNGSTPTVICGTRPYCDRARCLNGCSSNTTSGGVCIASSCNNPCNGTTGCSESTASCASISSGSRVCVCESSIRVATPPPVSTLTPGVSTCTAATAMPSNMYCCYAGVTGIVKRIGEACTTPVPNRIATATPNPITSAPIGQTSCTAGYLEQGDCCANGKRSRVYRYNNCTTQNLCDYNDSACNSFVSTATNTPAPRATNTPPSTATETPARNQTATPAPTCSTWDWRCRIGVSSTTPRITPSPSPTFLTTQTPTPTVTYTPVPSEIPNTLITPSPLPSRCAQTYTYTECCGTGRRRSVTVTNNSSCVAQYSIGTCSDTPANDTSCGMHEQYNTNVSTISTSAVTSCPAGYYFDERPPFGWSNCQPIRCNEGYSYNVDLTSCIPIGQNMTPQQRTCDLNGQSVGAGHSTCDGTFMKICVNPANGEEDQWNRIECRNGCNNGACRP